MRLDDEDDRYLTYEEREARDKKRPHILIVDDTLDMDINRMELRGVLSGVDEGLGRYEKNSPVVSHAKSREQAEQTLRYWKDDGCNVAAVICDYKLHTDDGRDEWGTETLKALHDSGAAPKTLFLTSKSGFREEDKHKLDAIGAQYMHTYELLYAFAHTAGDERQKQACSQRASTSNFRQWCNETLGKDYALNKYISPNVAAAERAMLPISEVMKRRKAGAQDPAIFDMLDATSLRRALRPRVDDTHMPASERIAIGSGIEGPSVQGRLAFGQDDIDRIHAEHPGEPVILVLPREYLASDNNTLLAPENAIRGIVLMDRGTQHIPVLAENRNIPVLFANRGKYAELAVRGAELISFDGAIDRGCFSKAGEWVTLDGQSQELFAGKRDIIKPREQDWADVRELARVATSHASLPWHVKDEADMEGLKVLVNADSARDIAAAKAVPGIAGSGLVRTEHMFLEKEPMELLQNAIAGDEQQRADAAARLTELQTEQFNAIYDKAGEKFPVKIRLLDAPPQEFLPDPADEKATAELAARLGRTPEEVRDALTPVFKQNLRGAGFGRRYEAIYKAQLEALFKAASEHHVEPQVMIPVLRDAYELEAIAKMVAATAAKYDMAGKYKLGAMLETDESVIHYDKEQDARDQSEVLLKAVVKYCSFVSFGTNDLTQELLQLDRNDPQAVERWQKENREYIDPFATLSSPVRNAIHYTIQQLGEYAQHNHKKLEIGLCGRHASDRSTIEFCQRQRMNSISVAPTPDMMYQGVVEAGRAAVLSATEHREKLNNYMRKKRELAKSLQEGNLPKHVAPTGKKMIEHADTVAVYIEDDPMQLETISGDLAHLPVVFCDNINDGLNSIEALKSKGKHVVLITDMNVGLAAMQEAGDEDGWNRHPLADKLLKDMDNASGLRPGVALANAVARGELPGVEAADTVVASMVDPPRRGGWENHNACLDERIDALPKDSRYYYEDCEEFINKRSEAHKATAPRSVKEKPPEPVVLFVDDNEQDCQMFREGFTTTFGRGTELRIVHSGHEALEQMRRGDVTLMLADHLMPDMSGGELISTLRSEGNKAAMALITQQPDIEPKPGYADVEIFPKDSLIDVDYNDHNRLRKYISESLGMMPQRRRASWQEEFGGSGGAEGAGGGLGGKQWLR